MQDLFDQNSGESQDSGVGRQEATSFSPASSAIPFIELDTLDKGRAAPIDQAFPGMRQNIDQAIRKPSRSTLDRDLRISMPRMEDVDLSAALSEDDDDINEEIKSYVSSVGNFGEYVGRAIENLIVYHLNQNSDEWNLSDKDLKFARNTVQYPDIILVDDNESESYFHIEVKTWYALSNDLITSRFHTSPKFIKKDSLLVVFPWCISNLIYGSPILLSPLVYNALELAKRRDEVWVSGKKQTPDLGTKKVETPDPDHVFTCPVNSHNVKSIGYQRSSKDEEWEKESENFAKIYRFYHSKTYELRDKVYQEELLGRPIIEWRNLLDLDTTGA